MSDGIFYVILPTDMKKMITILGPTASGKDTQTDCFACQEPLPIEELPFLD